MSEKERQSDNSSSHLGEIAGWKSVGKSRLFGKDKKPTNLTIQKPADLDEINSFRSPSDNVEKTKNDSEVSFGQNNVKVSDLTSKMNLFQNDWSENKVSNKDLIEFRSLLGKLNTLFNNYKKESSSVSVEEKFDSK